MKYSNEELVIKYQSGENEVLEDIVNNNIFFIKKVIKKYSWAIEKSTTFAFEDVLQEGIIGLIESVNKFDAGKDNKLLTYSYHYIKLRVFSFLFGKSPRDRENNMFNRKTSSLNVLIGEDGTNELQEIIEDTKAQDHMEEVLSVYDNNILKNDIIAALNDNLNNEEKELIYLRFGFKEIQNKIKKTGLYAYSLEDIKDYFPQYKQSKLRLIENKAFSKLIRSSWGRSIAMDRKIETYKELTNKSSIKENDIIKIIGLEDYIHSLGF